MKSFYIKTFGCQMNEHDSLKIAGLLVPLGFVQVDQPEDASLILFNTCTVREKAHHKAFSEIGRVMALKKEWEHKPMIGVCGCVAQEEGAKLLSRFPGLDLVFGPDQMHRLPALMEIVEESHQPAIATELVNRAEDYHFLDALPITRLSGPKSYVTVMKGCNSRCSYCIVPKVRGTEVYRLARDIVREVQLLAEKGCKEVTLLGQNVNSYGQGSEDGITFAKLIRLLSDNTDVARIRFTSPHPKDVKEDLIEEYATNSKLSPHIHLPLQSGSDTTLRRMRRAYNTTIYRAKIEALRAVLPDIAITTDIIVGFPGESDHAFEETLQCIRDIDFDGIYSFKYSPRPDTEAYHEMQDDVPLEAKDVRLSKLLALQNELSFTKNQKLVGKIEEVLVEGKAKSVGGKWMGRTGGNKIANFTGQDVTHGAILKVEITKANSNSLEGICQATAKP